MDVYNNKLQDINRVLLEEICTRKVDSNDLSGGNSSNPEHFLDNFDLAEQFSNKICIVRSERVGGMQEVKFLFISDGSSKKGEVVVCVF